MAANILLVRHGQTKSNVTGYYMGWAEEDLNETGYDQVRRLAVRLAQTPIAAIYTSPIKRALTTAKILAGSHLLTPQPTPDLAEINIGDWAGMSGKDIQKRWPEIWEKWRFEPSKAAMPNGESVRQVEERAVRAFTKIAADNTDRQTLIVTHDIIVKIIVSHVLGASQDAQRRFDVSNASLTVIRARESGYRIAVLNDRAHLKDPYLRGEYL